MNMCVAARSIPLRPFVVLLTGVFAILASAAASPVPGDHPLGSFEPGVGFGAAPHVEQGAQHAHPSGAGGGGGGIACAAMLADLPIDIDFVLIINDASSLRQSELGRVLGGLLAESDAVPLTGKSWTELCRKLGWGEQQAFDNLLGKRLLLIGKDMADPDKRRWVIVSDVSDATRQRLGKSLAAAPRALYRGNQILAVEDGKLELTAVARTEPATNRKTPLAKAVGDGTAQAAKAHAPGEARPLRLILGPADHPELFERMIDGPAAGPQGKLGTTAVPEAARSLGRASIVLLTRPPEAAPVVAVPGVVGGGDAKTPGPVRSAWDRFLVIASESVNAQGSEWSTRIVYRDPERVQSLLNVPVTSNAQFRSLESNSLLAVLQVLPVTSVLGPGFPLGDMLGRLRSMLPDDAHALMSARQVLRIRQVEAPVDGAQPAAPIAVDARPTASPTPNPLAPKAQLVCSIAFETQDPAALARVLDGSIAGVIQAAEQQGGGGQLQPHNFAGLAPAATRIVPMEFGTGSPVRSALGVPLTVAWAYPSPPAGMAPNAAVANPPASWWIAMVTPSAPLDVDPSPAQLLAQDTAALLAPDAGGEAKRWLWMASCRPAAVEHLLPDFVPDYRGVRTIMRRLDRAAGSLSITDDGLIRGEINLELVGRNPELVPPQPINKAR